MVGLAARRHERLQEVSADIRASGGIAIPVPTDVSDEQQATSFVERVHQEFGRLDILVNNAGMLRISSVLDANTSEWRDMTM